jgi:hypothetical protein
MLNKELHDLYSLSDIVSVRKLISIKWVEHVACMGESKNAYTVLVRISEDKRVLGKARHRWVVSIKMDLKIYNTRV